MGIRRENFRMVGKLAVVTAGMFAFGYALVPIYRAICEVTGINILALGDKQIPGASTRADVANTQVDKSRLITVEFDANSRGPWEFRPAQRSIQVHPGELATVMYEFQNVQNRSMAAQAIPSYAPKQASPHFNKLECFCFNQYTLEPGEKKQWPVAFVIDPRLSKDVTTITLSYTFFEVGGKTPAAPSSTLVPQAAVQLAPQAVQSVQIMPGAAARAESRS
ncbi:MAG: cytochrome c oxidase assembly protein [Burkholderiaceae bacterium]